MYHGVELKCESRDFRPDNFYLTAAPRDCNTAAPSFDCSTAERDLIINILLTNDRLLLSYQIYDISMLNPLVPPQKWSLSAGLLLLGFTPAGLEHAVRM
jgi:hypothetical protein